jgi:hypothetical protein
MKSFLIFSTLRSLLLTLYLGATLVYAARRGGDWLKSHLRIKMKGAPS